MSCNTKKQAFLSMLLLFICAMVFSAGCSDASSDDQPYQPPSSQLSSDTSLTITIGTLSTDASGNPIIKWIPYNTTLQTLTAAITPAAGASFSIYGSNGSAAPAVIVTGCTVIVTAENGDQQEYPVFVNPAWLSSDATLVSDIGIVSKNGTPDETITAIPDGTTVSELKAAITPSSGATFEIYLSDLVTPAGELITGCAVIVTAEDHNTRTTYIITVDLPGLCSDPRLRSDEYIVSDGISAGETISAVPYGATLDHFINALAPVAGATFEVYEEDGVTMATDLGGRYVVLAIAENLVDFVTYTVLLDGENMSSDSRLTSSIGTVSTGASSTQTITGVPFGTTLEDFRNAITPAAGAVFEIYDSDGIKAIDLTTGYFVLVYAEDGVHQTRYEVTVLPKIVTGRKISSGTYTGNVLGQSQPTTYVFENDGDCSRSGPDGMGGTISTEGEWAYDSNNVLTINTTGYVTTTVSPYGTVTVTVRIIETYGAAFTTDAGDMLTFVNFRREAADHSTILGAYAGDDDFSIDIRVSYLGVVIDSYSHVYTATMNVMVYDNSMWEASGIMYIDGVEEGDMNPIGTWSAGDNILVLFNGNYYLGQVYEDFLFTR